MQEKIVILGMGGTIAGKSGQPGDNVGYTAGQVAVADLLEALPGLQQRLNNRVVVAEQVAQIDSKDLEFSDWIALTARLRHHLQQADVCGVVVTHGTDTLEETAYFLSQVLSAELSGGKPVVLTCAMRPASSLVADGPGNLMDAVTVAGSAQACGVLVVCAGTIHRAEVVQKVHPYQTNAFDSGEAGPIAYVEEAKVRAVGLWPVPGTAHGAWMLPAEPWPRVELVSSHAGVDARLVRALLSETAAPEDRLQGLVVVAPGNGSIHRSLMAALMDAHARGIRIVRASRCAYGQIVGPHAADDAYITDCALSAIKARIRLMLDLMPQRPEQ